MQPFFWIEFLLNDGVCLFCGLDWRDVLSRRHFVSSNLDIILAQICIIVGHASLDIVTPTELTIQRLSDLIFVQGFDDRIKARLEKEGCAVAILVTHGDNAMYRRNIVIVRLYL